MQCVLSLAELGAELLRLWWMKTVNLLLQSLVDLKLQGLLLLTAAIISGVRPQSRVFTNPSILYVQFQRRWLSDHLHIVSQLHSFDYESNSPCLENKWLSRSSRFHIYLSSGYNQDIIFKCFDCHATEIIIIRALDMMTAAWQSKQLALNIHH